MDVFSFPPKLGEHTDLNNNYGFFSFDKLLLTSWVDISNSVFHVFFVGKITIELIEK